MITLNGTPLEIKKFPVGESIIEKQWFDKYRIIGAKDYLELFYESDADLTQLLLIRKAIWFPIDLHIPYFPYSRMDRKSEDYVFTLKSICKFINWLEFDNVYIYEPHSDVTPALLNHCKIVDLIPNLLKNTPFDRDLDYIFYPDANAYKKYSDVLRADNEIVGFKKRDFTTGKITDLQIVGGDSAIRSQENWALRGKKVYIIDDLCSKGGTFVLAAEEIAKMQAEEINLVVAHCEDTIHRGNIFKNTLINKVYTTNTIIREYDADPIIEGRLKIFPYQSLK